MDQKIVPWTSLLSSLIKVRLHKLTNKNTSDIIYLSLSQPKLLVVLLILVLLLLWLWGLKFATSFSYQLRE